MFNQVYEERRSAEKIISGVNRVLSKAKREGRPTTDPEKLLEFMADPNNPKDPQNAYDIMFKDELNKWREEQLMKAKGQKFVTEEGSTAGSKQPVPKTLKTFDELKSSLKEHLGASE